MEQPVLWGVEDLWWEMVQPEALTSPGSEVPVILFLEKLFFCSFQLLLIVLFLSSGIQWRYFAILPVLLIAVILVAARGGRGGGKGASAAKGRKTGDSCVCSKCHQTGHNTATCSNAAAVASREDIAGMQPIGSFFGAAGGSSSSGGGGGGGAGANRG